MKKIIYTAAAAVLCTIPLHTASPDQHRKINIPAAYIKSYTVKRGDTLYKIARHFDITLQLLRKLNNLTKNQNTIIPGQKLKVIKGPFNARVIKEEYILEITLNKKTILSFPVGLGKNNSTPTGTFTVGTKLTNPPQIDRRTHKIFPFGHPEHTIGTRWIELKRPYGIHGTKDPQSIGKQESRGCVRMLNKDVEEIYDLLVSKKSRVTIVNSRDALK